MPTIYRQMSVVYVIQKSKQYGLKQYTTMEGVNWYVVYVIQKSKQYGLKQLVPSGAQADSGCVCHSKK